jgi:elongation of very long chain fatty acids protein 4
MSAIWREFSSFALPIGEAIKIWSRPEGWKDAPTSTYFGAGFDFALAIALAYLAFVVFGSIFMSSTKFTVPKKVLYPIKFVYNMVQVMLCSYMCIEASVQAFRSNYTLLPCNTFDRKNPPISFILWVFYLSKILDFLDTVFIIVDRKWKQLSFLHVYHHTSIFLVSDLYII